MTTAAAPAKAPYLTYHDGTFIWIGKPENKDIPKSAGFRYAPAPKYYWWSRDFDVAVRIDRRYADAKALAVIGDRMVEHEGQPSAPPAAVINAEAIASSRATDADLAIPCPDGLEYMGFQRAGIAYAIERFNSATEGGDANSSRADRGVLIGDEMG